MQVRLQCAKEQGLRKLAKGLLRCLLNLTFRFVRENDENRQKCIRAQPWNDPSCCHRLKLYGRTFADHLLGGDGQACNVNRQDHASLIAPFRKRDYHLFRESFAFPREWGSFRVPAMFNE